MQTREDEVALVPINMEEYRFVVEYHQQLNDISFILCLNIMWSQTDVIIINVYDVYDYY